MKLKTTFTATTILLGLAGAMAPLAQAQDQHTAATEAAAMPVYRNGGIGMGEQHAMKQAAHDYNLRMLFSENKDDNFVADVKLHIANDHGKQVFALSSAGPMTDVRLPDGTYRVTASYKGLSQSRTVHLAGTQGENLSFHWNTTG